LKTHKEIFDEYKAWISDYDKNVCPTDNLIEQFKLMLLNTAITAKIEMLEWVLDIKMSNEMSDDKKTGMKK